MCAESCKHRTVLFFVLIISAFLPLRVLGQVGAPTGLLCNLLRFPEHAVITDLRPAFSWIVNDRRQNAVQAAYQVQVATSEEALRRGQPDVWDSGRIDSDQSVSVRYAGNRLKTGTSYWWQVRTWDAAGQASPFSKPQRFITGQPGKAGRAWAGESKWVQTSDGEWVLENRQRGSYEEVRAEKTIRLADGHYFADFGRAAFGTLRLWISARQDGDSAIVFLGERKTEDNLVHKNPGKSNIGFKRLVLPLKKGRHDYEVVLPRHVSHYPNSQVLAGHMPEVMPFRYAEVLGNPGMKAEAFRQLALFYPFEEDASHFTSSDARLNAVWNLSKYTLKATPFLSLYMDGNRERMPYEADSYIQQLGHYSVDREYAVARYTMNFLLYNASWPTEWIMHTILMAWTDYMYTGDRTFAETYYEELKAKTLLELAGDDGLISSQMGRVTPDFLESIHYSGKDFRDIVDWPAPSERDGFEFRPVNTVVNAFHYRSLVLMTDLAQALGKQQDAAFFQNRAAQVYKRFNDLLLDKSRGIYVDGAGTDHASIHANLFPLAFGLVPETYRASVSEYVESKGMACSVYGAQYLLDGLYNAGRSKYALNLMTSDSKRSWLNMMRVGSTMTTEAWDESFKPNLTWNHAWGSAPANIIPRRLMGIEPVEAGFRTVRIQPRVGDLQQASVKMPTVRGPIEVAWTREGSAYRLNVSIPANMRAEILLPDNDTRHVGAGKHTFSGILPVKNGP